jgi:hypothetical protein
MLIVQLQFKPGGNLDHPFIGPAGSIITKYHFLVICLGSFGVGVDQTEETVQLLFVFVQALIRQGKLFIKVSEQAYYYIIEFPLKFLLRYWCVHSFILPRRRVAG